MYSVPFIMSNYGLTFPFLLFSLLSLSTLLTSLFSFYVFLLPSFSSTFGLSLFFEKEFCCIAQIGFKLSILLPVFLSNRMTSSAIVLAWLLSPSLLSALFRVTLVPLFSNPVPPGSVSQGAGIIGVHPSPVSFCLFFPSLLCCSSLFPSSPLHIFFGAQDI